MLRFLSLLFLCNVVLSGLFETFSSSSKGKSFRDFAAEKILENASPIFGKSSNNGLTTETSMWMAKYPDSTKLVHMNLPGTHDSQTWDYSSDTRKNLNHITRLGGTIVAPSKFFRCQELSLVSMLDAGIRVFDLRFAFDVTKSNLVFWHGQALQSQTATVEDVLFAFFNWLNNHPSEVILVSLKYEELTTLFGRNNIKLQTTIFDVLTSTVARKYILGSKNYLGTLGAARGKIILLRRFELDKLPHYISDKMPGIYFPKSKWTWNGKDIVMKDDKTPNFVAHIEDFFHITNGKKFAISSTSQIIQLKYQVTTDHLIKAMSVDYRDDLFWTFASGEKNTHIPPLHPKVIALGNEEIEGMNQKLTNFFVSHQGTGKRLGIVMFDFFNTPSNLVQSFLAVQPPRPINITFDMT